MAIISDYFFEVKVQKAREYLHTDIPGLLFKPNIWTQGKMILKTSTIFMAITMKSGVNYLWFYYEWQHSL